MMLMREEFGDISNSKGKDRDETNDEIDSNEGPFKVEAKVDIPIYIRWLY